jgi:hypothetical protein
MADSDSGSETSDEGPLCISFEDFAEAASSLYNEKTDATDDELAHLLLSGRYEGDKSVRIHHDDNFIEDAVLPDLATTRDLDSLIAVSKSLPYSCCLPIHLVPRPTDTLSKDVHITVPVITVSVSAMNFGCGCGSRY